MAWVIPSRKRNVDPDAIAPAADAAGASDESLMQRYAHGDAGAFEVLYHRHKGPLYRYVLRGVGNRATADELYQDIWLRLIQARNGYQPRARFSTWLFTLAHNRVVDHYRRSRPTAHEIPEQTAPRHEQPEEQAGQSQRAARLKAAIATLPFEQREAFVLKQERGFGVAEIASITGVKPETAKSRLRYAVARLREVLHDETH